MIYPRCYTGVYSLYVSCTSYLYPCCNANVGIYNKKIEDIYSNLVDNPFNDDNFSLLKNDISKILFSKKWNDFIDNKKYTDLEICHRMCSKSIPPTSSSMGHLKKRYENWNEKNKRSHIYEKVQIETSDRCVLKCLYCRRNRIKKLNRIDMPISTIKNILSYKYFNTIQDCGNFGDPIYYKHYHEMLELLSNSLIETYNASIAATGRSDEWWNKTLELWEKMIYLGINVQINWGIDGLKGVSNKHRVNQDWDDIIYRMESASKIGVKGLWRFIPMSFNEHQIEECETLAKKMGIHLYLHKSNRFNANDLNMPSEGLFEYEK